MKRVSLFCVVASLSLLGCGPDGELVASGKIHSCTLASLTAQLESDPANAELQDQVRQRAELLRAVVETAGEGERSELEEAIRDAVAEGCD